MGDLMPDHHSDTAKIHRRRELLAIENRLKYAGGEY